MYIYIYTYVYTYVYIFIYIYLYVNIHIYIYIYINQRNQKYSSNTHNPRVSSSLTELLLSLIESLFLTLLLSRARVFSHSRNARVSD